MGRAPRGTYAGGVYHINTRGNNKARVYVDGLDRLVFLRILERVQLRYEWEIFSWCLMGNHYHVVLRVPEDGLSAGIRDLNGGFARWANGRHERCDHVFGRRFSSKEIVSDAHLLEACRYVALNPVRAQLCRHPIDWRWSSYRACAGLERPASFLAFERTMELFRDAFGSKHVSAFDAYARFIEAGLLYLEQRRSAPAVSGTGEEV